MSAPGNTRVVEQKALQQFREEMSEKVKDPYTVIMRSKKLPMALLSNPYEVCIDVCVCVCVCVCIIQICLPMPLCHLLLSAGLQHEPPQH